MTKRLLFLLPVLIFLVVAGYFLWGLGPERDPKNIPTVMIDRPTPGFDLAAVPGVGVPGLATADLGKGQVVLVNFFASWCVPCRAEHAFLTDLAEETGVPLYGINHRDKPEDAAAWLAELGNPYTRIGADPGRAAVEWGVTGVPETFVVDREGRIRYHHRGPLVPDVIERQVKPLLEELRS
ncbi:DsbE family thiol:disulfide interchange protein [Pelagibius sp. CAU 1746]|uniref:DsbE family thiol:disulfide interchange protein n=1 Tax=Pelagibius sp. CAU 1746 TaxID=3140370 RepID=UPI00325B8751